MNSTIIRAAAVVIGLANAGPALAVGTPQAYVAGSGENQSVAYEGGVPVGSVQPRAVVTGTGENISVQHIDAPLQQAPGYIAVVVGSGENQSVVHVPAGAPRG